ncbi:hypothetical protein BD414DRAFT_174083 [Trametes punicea]|nr:hypothetical protein BD414DRAFT_174083 [Trametes punicea]
MPRRRSSSESTGKCQVVPADGEHPCTQPGFRDHPRLCSNHRKEYGRLTAAYKATSEEAECLYAEVRAREWAVNHWDVFVVEDALERAQLCMEKIDKEIRERQEHHRRFFVELHDGHEAWIDGLRKKRRTVEKLAGQLRDCKAGLASPTKCPCSSELDSYSRHIQPPRLPCMARLREGGKYGDSSYCTSQSLASSLFCAVHLEQYHSLIDLHQSGVQSCEELEGDVLHIQSAFLSPAGLGTVGMPRVIDVLELYADLVQSVARYEEDLRRFPVTQPPPYKPAVSREDALVLSHRLRSAQCKMYSGTQRWTDDWETQRISRPYRSDPRHSRAPAENERGCAGAVCLGLVVAGTAACFGADWLSSIILAGMVLYISS